MKYKIVFTPEEQSMRDEMICIEDVHMNIIKKKVKRPFTPDEQKALNRWDRIGSRLAESIVGRRGKRTEVNSGNARGGYKEDYA